MKHKITTLFIILAVFQIAAKANTPAASWYRAEYSADKRLILPFDEWVSFNAESFSVKQDGVYTLLGDTFSTTDTGLTRISGSCWQSKAGFVQLVLSTSGAPVALAETTDTVFSFSAAFPSGAVQLRAYSGSDNFNELFCNVLLEKVR